MRRLAAVLFAAAVLALVPAKAHAQAYFNVFWGYSYGHSAGECSSAWSDCPNKPDGWGLAFGSYGKLFGFEEEFGWTSDFFGEGGDFQSNKVTTLMTHVLIGPRIGPVRIYGAGGFGLLKASIEYAPSITVANFSDTSWGYDYGYGVMLVLPAHLGVRFDYRRFKSTADVPYVGLVPRSNPFEFSRTTFGIVLH